MQAISIARLRGTLDRVGLNLKDGNNKPCNLWGLRFKSQKQAADYYGVSRQYIGELANASQH